LAVSAFSLILMWVTMSSRIGSLPDTIVVRRGAEGVATRFDSPSGLWQLPVLATFATLINLVVAWVTHPGNPLASRMTMAATWLVHLLVWVAIVQFVW